jgi:hypothetical protein
MKRLIAVAASAAALVAAAPAYAIHDPFNPAGDGDVVADTKSCSSPKSEAIGDPAGPRLATTPAGTPNPGRSEKGLANNRADPPCHNG